MSNQKSLNHVKWNVLISRIFPFPDCNSALSCSKSTLFRSGLLLPILWSARNFPNLILVAFLLLFSLADRERKVIVHLRQGQSMNCNKVEIKLHHYYIPFFKNKNRGKNGRNRARQNTH